MIVPWQTFSPFLNVHVNCKGGIRVIAPRCEVRRTGGRVRLSDALPTSWLASQF